MWGGRGREAGAEGGLGPGPAQLAAGEAVLLLHRGAQSDQGRAAQARAPQPPASPPRRATRRGCLRGGGGGREAGAEGELRAWGRRLSWQLARLLSCFTVGPAKRGGAGAGCWALFSLLQLQPELLHQLLLLPEHARRSSICLSFSCSIWSLSQLLQLGPRPRAPQQAPGRGPPPSRRTCSGEACSVSWVTGDVTISPKLSPGVSSRRLC